MSPDYVLTERAAADFADIYTYVAGDNRSAADLLLEQIREGCRTVAERPHLGRPRADIPDPVLRAWNVAPYVIVYELGTSPLEIKRILHGRRDFRKIFKP